MSFGTFFRYYDEHLLSGATDTSIGLIGGVQAFMVLLLSFIVGRLLDAKFHRIIVGVGGVLTWLGYFCLSFNSPQGPESQGSYGLIILTQSIIAGAGMSCFFTHSSHCAIQVRKQSAQTRTLEADILVEWFPQHKYFAVGITSAGAAAGMMKTSPVACFVHLPFGRRSCLSTGDHLSHHRTRFSCRHQACLRNHWWRLRHMLHLRCFQSSSEEAAFKISNQNVHLDRLRSIQESSVPSLLCRRRLHVLCFLSTLVSYHRVG